MTKIRALSAGVLCAAGLSLAGALVVPAVASAAPGQPNVGPAAVGDADQMHSGGSGRNEGRNEGPNRGPMHPTPPPTHPIYHYTDDLTHPVWSVTHPFWALVP